MSWPARRALLCLTYFTPRRRPNYTTGFAYKIASSIVKVSRLCVHLNYDRQGWLLQIIIKKSPCPTSSVGAWLSLPTASAKRAAKKSASKKMWMLQKNNGLHRFMCASVSRLPHLCTYIILNFTWASALLFDGNVLSSKNTNSLNWQISRIGNKQS